MFPIYLMGQTTESTFLKWINCDYKTIKQKAENKRKWALFLFAIRYSKLLRKLSYCQPLYHNTEHNDDIGDGNDRVPVFTPG